MMRLLGGLLLAAYMNAAQALECADMWSFLDRGCRRLVNTYQQGQDQLIVTGYAHHLRSTYTEEKLRDLNENAFGLGWGKWTEDPDGDSHSVFLMAFHESHRKVQINLGYAYQTYWGPRSGLQAGLGYTAMIVQRPDIASGVPIPALLPVASLRYGQASLMGTFIPTLNGGINNGSVLFLFGRYDFK
jgi:palmitoyl transferase